MVDDNAKKIVGLGGIFNNLTNDEPSLLLDHLMQPEESEKIDTVSISNTEKAIIEQKKHQIDIFGLLETEKDISLHQESIHEKDGVLDEFSELLQASNSIYIPESTMKKDLTKKASLDNRDPTPLIDKKMRN